MLYIQQFQVKGFTFPIKDQLKELGCRWENQLKVWMCNNDNKSLVQQLLDEVNLQQDDNIKEKWKAALNQHGHERVMKGSKNYDNVMATFKTLLKQ